MVAIARVAPGAIRHRSWAPGAAITNVDDMQDDQVTHVESQDEHRDVDDDFFEPQHLRKLGMFFAPPLGKMDKPELSFPGKESPKNVLNLN